MGFLKYQMTLISKFVYIHIQINNHPFYVKFPSQMQTLSVLDTRHVKHFAVEEEDYLIIVSHPTSSSSIQV